MDSFAFRLTFAQPLDPYRTLDTARVRLFALPDTTLVRLEGVWTGAGYDSIQARVRAAADSLRRARDTTARRTSREALSTTWKISRASPLTP